MKTAAPDEPPPRRRLDRWRKIVVIAFRGCLVLLFFRWISSRLPHISFRYLSLALGLVSRPAVAFVLGNAIIAALVVKSGRSSARSTDDDSADGNGFFDAITESQPASQLSSDSDGEDDEEVIVYYDKQILISETNRITPAPASAAHTDDTEDSDDTEMDKFSNRKKWREEEEELKQSTETMKYRKTDEELHLAAAPEDELSSEEFQRTIEAFIAKQLRLRQEESMAIVFRSDPTVDKMLTYSKEI